MVSIDRGIDSNLKKERERKERKEERLRRGNLTRARWFVYENGILRRGPVGVDAIVARVGASEMDVSN